MGNQRIVPGIVERFSNLPVWNGEVRRKLDAAFRRISKQDAPPHAKFHRFDGDDALQVGAPVNLGDSTQDGTAPTVSRSDHVHARAVEVLGDGTLVGTVGGVNFVAGAGVSVTVTNDGNEATVTVGLDDQAVTALQALPELLAEARRVLAHIESMTEERITLEDVDHAD